MPMLSPERIAKVDSAESLSSAILELRQTIESEPERWESETISAYLEAMAAWVTDGGDEFLPDATAQSWKAVATVLAAGAIYE
jgi:hypothetical protein